MGRLDWRMFLSIALIASQFQDAAQIIIKEQEVPSLVRSGSTDSIILDCDYDLEKSPVKGLVVKWYHNENDLVYQWIYGEAPQAIPPVTNYIDLSYKASKDPATMYRAMKLNNPDIDLTGDYTCTVFTYDDEDTATKPMTVYSTETRFELLYRKKTVNGVDGVEVTCVAEGLYPRPTLDVSVEKVSLEQKPVVTQSPDGRFQVTTRIELRDTDVQDPSNVICVLGIPEANYTVSREFPYYPGPSTTSTTSTTLQRKMDVQALDNSQPDTDNGGGSTASSISNQLILLLVSITTTGSVLSLF